MAHEGASVVVADLDGSAAERVAGDLGSAVAAEVDISDESSVVRMVETVVASFGSLDVPHKNATDSSTNATDTDIVTLDMAVFDRTVAVNLKGVVMGYKHAIPHLVARGGGSIVCTASIEGFVGRGCVPPTERPKPRRTLSEGGRGAVQGARDLVQRRRAGRRAHACGAGHDAGADRGVKQALPEAETVRAGGCGECRALLASDEAAFVNGPTLMVDGGATVYMPSTQFAGGGNS